MRSLYLKQLTNLGLPDWRIPACEYPAPHVEVIIFGSDQGPDQVRCIKLVKALPFVTCGWILAWQASIQPRKRMISNGKRADAGKQGTTPSRQTPEQAQ